MVCFFVFFFSSPSSIFFVVELRLCLKPLQQNPGPVTALFFFFNNPRSVLFQGSADPLNSAFHLTYNMVLNLLRVEEINPEYMLEKSFYQFQHYRALPGVVESEHNHTHLLQAFQLFVKRHNNATIATNGQI